MKLYFDPFDTKKVRGAKIENYLLEKARVVGCTRLERNYHAFFYILRGAGDDLARKLGFFEGGRRKEHTDFRFLRVCNDLIF